VAIKTGSAKNSFDTTAVRSTYRSENGVSLDSCFLNWLFFILKIWGRFRMRMTFVRISGARAQIYQQKKTQEYLDSMKFL
jgi:hypothetical protein